MKKLSPREQRLLALLHGAGGSYCPGLSVDINRDVKRAANRLKSLGLIHIEETDDGPRFTVRSHG